MKRTFSFLFACALVLSLVLIGGCSDHEAGPGLQVSAFFPIYPIWMLPKPHLQTPTVDRRRWSSTLPAMGSRRGSGFP